MTNFTVHVRNNIAINLQRFMPRSRWRDAMDSIQMIFIRCSVYVYLVTGCTVAAYFVNYWYFITINMR
ncbi:hypothetical protein BDF21DRAFT_409667 [Thamnidium elegans]|nr:hypothetical protein BDF21DRAFT_409667 [Thamnidium elegans]